MTSHQLGLMKEKEARAAAAAAAERADAASRTVTEAAYAAQVEVEISNKAEDVAEARSMEAAIEALSLGAAGEADRHPEK